MKIETAIAAQPTNLLDLFRRLKSTPERKESQAPVQRPGEDRIEISREAQHMNRVQEALQVRESLIKRIKGEIAAGTYDVEGRLDTALDRMIDDVTE